MKKLIILFSLILSLFIVAGCSSATTEVDEVEEKVTDTGVYNTVDLASEIDTLKTTVLNNLVEDTYHSDTYNLDIPYGVYVPEGYDESEKYPLVMFIPDSTLAGKSVEDCIDQGYGGVVWAADQVQTGNPALILYPAYPEVTVDDHNGYTISDYVPATVGLIDTVKENYSVDINRIYATGQSMGCMTSMILASDNPDLFAACMFVDGQWEASALAPLADQTFCYFAAHDDTSAYTGMQEAIPVWEENGASIVEVTWDGTWDHEQMQEEAQRMLEQESKIYCIEWKEGTIEAKQMGGPGGGSGNGPGASIGVHMASFNYAYNVNTMVGWILLQSK